MVQKMVEMGMDLIEVKDFIEDRGMFEENPEIIIDQMNNPRYINPLRAGWQAQQQPRQQPAQYAYVDH